MSQVENICDYPEIAARVKAAQIATGIHYDEITARAGVKKGTWFNITKGDTETGAVNLAKVAACVGLRPDAVFLRHPIPSGREVFDAEDIVCVELIQDHLAVLAARAKSVGSRTKPVRRFEQILREVVEMTEELVATDEDEESDNGSNGTKTKVPNSERRNKGDTGKNEKMDGKKE